MFPEGNLEQADSDAGDEHPEVAGEPGSRPDVQLPGSTWSFP